MNYEPEDHQLFLNRGRALIQAKRDAAREGGYIEGPIMALIADGTDTRDAIIRTAHRYVTCRYAAIAQTLDAKTGPLPDRHLWFRDDDNVYHLHVSPQDQLCNG